MGVGVDTGSGGRNRGLGTMISRLDGIELGQAGIEKMDKLSKRRQSLSGAICRIYA